MTTIKERVDDFLAQKRIAVAGVSRDRNGSLEPTIVPGIHLTYATSGHSGQFFPSAKVVPKATQ